MSRREDELALYDLPLTGVRWGRPCGCNQGGDDDTETCVQVVKIPGVVDSFAIRDSKDATKEPLRFTGEELGRRTATAGTWPAQPPLETVEWLHKQVKPEATWPLPEGCDEAYAWLQGQLQEHPRNEWDVPPEAQLAYARDCINRGADVVWGYYSARSRYVSRTLVVCPRDGERCPAPPAHA